MSEFLFIMIGRTVQLRVSDGDRGKLGQLCGLALEAGFDWVYYQSYDFIRVSVIPDGKEIVCSFVLFRSLAMFNNFLWKGALSKYKTYSYLGLLTFGFGKQTAILECSYLNFVTVNLKRII